MLFVQVQVLALTLCTVGVVHSEDDYNPYLNWLSAYCENEALVEQLSEEAPKNREHFFAWAASIVQQYQDDFDFGTHTDSEASQFAVLLVQLWHGDQSDRGMNSTAPAQHRLEPAGMLTKALLASLHHDETRKDIRLRLYAESEPHSTTSLTNFAILPLTGGMSIGAP